jgi:tRNA dimethylallyltransferase
MEKTPVLCVVGPTASGKTALAVRLAQAFGGEIVNMDSMQVYRRMDIGTAKPNAEERGGIPHHLIDIVEPTEPFTVAQYATAAETCLPQIFARGKLPILTGGTGFYLRALTDGLALGGVPSDAQLRESLKSSAADEDGKRKLYGQLIALDAQTAAKLHPNDITRVSRAVEVCLLTGKPFSRQENQTGECTFRFCVLGTTLERAALYQRAEERVDAMMARGLLNEVAALLHEGVPPDAQAMQGIGYKELVPVVLGGAPLSDAITLLKRNTRRYAKRQWTWFNADKQVQWLDMAQEDSVNRALDIGARFWKEGQT